MIVCCLSGVIKGNYSYMYIFGHSSEISPSHQLNFVLLTFGAVDRPPVRVWNSLLEKFAKSSIIQPGIV